MLGRMSTELLVDRAVVAPMSLEMVAQETHQTLHPVKVTTVAVLRLVAFLRVQAVVVLVQ